MPALLRSLFCLWTIFVSFPTSCRKPPTRFLYKRLLYLPNTILNGNLYATLLRNMIICLIFYYVTQFLFLQKVIARLLNLCQISSLLGVGKHTSVRKLNHTYFKLESDKARRALGKGNFGLNFRASFSAFFLHMLLRCYFYVYTKNV